MSLGADGASQEAGAAEGRDDEDPRCWHPLQQLRGGGQPVGAGHIHVHEDDVGPVRGSAAAVAALEGSGRTLTRSSVPVPAGPGLSPGAGEV